MTTAKTTTATVSSNVLSRDLNLPKITCPDCGGKNGSHRLNQKCDWCGFFLNVRLFPDHSRYVRGLATTASGRDTYDVADETADQLRGLGVDEVLDVTSKALASLPIEVALSVKMKRQFTKSNYEWTSEGVRDWLREKYQDRNPGMIRMNCGNVLRAASKRSA